MGRILQKALIDSHIVIWLHEGSRDLLSHKVRNILQEATELILPSTVFLELQFLYQKNRLAQGADQIVYNLGATILDSPYKEVVTAAMPLSWTRDPFDRLIVAEALHHKLPLITADKLIRKHCKLAVW